MKIFIDRWYGIKQSFFRGKRVILAIPMGGGNIQYARHTVAMFTDIFDYLGMKLHAQVLAPGVGRLGEVKEQKDIMKEAFRVGKTLVA